jgi:ATPase family associated with various cellular activities (AAA)
MAKTITYRSSKGKLLMSYRMPDVPTESTSTFNYSTSYGPAFLKNCFAFKHSEDIIHTKFQFPLSVSPTSLLNTIRDNFDPKSRILILDNETILIGEKFIIVLEDEDNEKAVTATEETCDSIIIRILSTPDLMEELQEIIKKHRKNQVSVELWYYVETKTRQIHLPLDPYGEYHPEFYPWLESDYFDRYLKSKAMVLFLTGAPGTGKTSVLRHFLLTNKLNAITTYDEEVLKREQIFVDFITSKEKHIMIAEDADVLLEDRQRFGNNIMNKFLNYSEGLVKFPDKKIIFTSNLHNFDRVDPALARTGRCFGNKESRALTYQETLIAAKIAGIEGPIEERNHTIAELMAYKEGQTNTIKQRKVGFAV